MVKAATSTPLGIIVTLSGPSGVGKTTIIDKVLEIDSSFEFPYSYTTRPLRQTEKNAPIISISNEEFSQMEEAGKFLFANSGRVWKYGLTKLALHNVIAQGKIPIFDFPLGRIGELKAFDWIRVISFYILPPNFKTLRKRLAKRQRILGESDSEMSRRIDQARDELHSYKEDLNFNYIDHIIKNGEIEDAAESIVKSCRGV